MNVDIREYIDRLISGINLDFDDTRVAMNRILSGKTSPSQLAGFLAALKAKGETVDEISGIATALRERCVRVEVPQEYLIDNTGTGGDGLGTFNISTAAAIVAAAAGVRIAKHINRAVSSRCGSANVLHALGIKIDGGPRTFTHAVDELDIGVMFSPLFHPTLQKTDMPRYELGIRTILDIITPLVNPAGVGRIVMGVSFPDLLEPLVDVMIRLGAGQVMAFSSSDGMDELSLSGVNHVIEFKDGAKKRYDAGADAAGLKSAPLSDIRGGDADDNAVIILDVLNGREGPPLDIVAYNAGAALYVGGEADSLAAGVAIALDTIRSGKAKKKLEQWKALSRDSSD